MKVQIISNIVIAVNSLLFSSSSLGGVINELPMDLFNKDVSPYQASKKTNFPESVPIKSNFISNEYDFNISLDSSSNVSISFMDEGAYYRNSLGYFSYSNFFGFEDINRMDRFSNDWNLISDNNFNDAIYKINLSNPMALRNNDTAGFSAVPTPPLFLLILTGLLALG